jgi:hypothetical protein
MLPHQSQHSFGIYLLLINVFQGRPYPAISPEGMIGFEFPDSFQY